MNYATKQTIHLVFFVFLLNSCHINEEYSPTDNAAEIVLNKYYEQAVNCINFNKYNSTRSDESVSNNEFSVYAPYGEKFINILHLTPIEINEIVTQSSYKKMVSSYENSLDNSIFEYITVKEYKNCCKVIKEYFIQGGHSVKTLNSLIDNFENENFIKLVSYTAASLDEYIEQEIMNVYSREIASDKVQKSCEEILVEKLAILFTDVAAQCVFTCFLPPSWITAGITSIYATATSVLYVSQYYECVKRRESKDDDKP